MRLETERLVLRRWTEAKDRDAFAEMCRDAEVMRWLGGVRTRENADSRIDAVEAAFEAHGYGRFLVERQSDGAFLGWCGAMPGHPPFPCAPEPEVGWRLVRSAWGQGYATEMAQAAFADLFRRVGLSRAFAYTVPPNLASQAVMGRLGLVRRADLDFTYPDLAEGDPLRQSLVWEALSAGR